MKEKNLLVLLCDQLQRNVLDIYGGPVKTRAWQQLADNGVVFNNFYCASPLCAPTRPSMMTGKWPHSHGSICFGDDYFCLNKGEELLITHLNDHGYQVAYDGIWHINQHEEDKRIDDYAYFTERSFSYSNYASMCKEFGLDIAQGSRTVCIPSENGPLEWKFSVPAPLPWTGSIEKHPDMLITQGIIDFIKNADKNKPFAAWCSLGAPHPPIMPPQEFLNLYKSEDMIPPPGFGEDMSQMPKTTTEWAPGCQSVKGWNWENWSKAIAGYYAFTAFADYCMKKVLDVLQESGQYEDTIIIATADHGEMLGAHNLYQKGVLYDRAIRLPFIVSNIGENGRCSQLGSHVDMPSTILDLLQQPPMNNVQGKSLVPMLSNLKTTASDNQFIEFNGYINGGIYSRAVMSCTHKYIYHHNDKDMLFNLQDDPDEMINIIDDPEYANVLQKFRNELLVWMQQTNDFLLKENFNL